MNCQRSVSREWLGKIAAHVNPLKCLTLCGVGRFGWQKGGRQRIGERGKKNPPPLFFSFTHCWFEVTLNTHFVSLHLSTPPPNTSLPLCCYRCGRRPDKERRGRAAPHTPAQGARRGLGHEGLPLLWEELPHLPPPEGPSEDTHR